MLVRDWMTSPPETARPGQTLAEAWRRMHERAFRHLPVVDDQGIVLGVLSERDLARYTDRLAEVTVETAMTSPAITVRPDDSIERAAERMVRKRISSLPVVDDHGRPVGILTTTDLLAGLLRFLRAGEESTARIDFTFPSDQHGFPELVHTVESAGGRVLALGTTPRARPGDRSRFYVRVRAAELDAVVDAMRREGYDVLDVYCPLRG